MTTMDRVVVIRVAPKDVAAELLKTVIMSHVNPAFFSFIMTETIIHLVVLLSAMFFIFVGLPVGWCLSTIPIVAVLVYASTYAYHAAKVIQITSAQPMCCWIAEAYEPYFMTSDPRDFKYTVVDESDFDEASVNKAQLRKKVVGAVAVRDYLGPVNKLWMYGLAVDAKYRRKGVAINLIRNAYKFTERREFESLEAVITDLQSEARLMLIKAGFKLKNVYHKRMFGIVPFGKYQMGISTKFQPE